MRRSPLLALAAAALLAAAPASGQTYASLVVARRAPTTAYDQPPQPLNHRAVLASLHDRYPGFRDVQLGGITRVRVTVRVDGTPADVAVHGSAENPMLDSVALAMVGAMRFTPAKLQGRDVEAATTLPIAFGPPEEPASPDASADFVGVGAPREKVDEGAIGEVEVRPELVNRPTLQRAITSGYPGALRAAGIGGTATVRFRVMPSGEPESFELARSTGNAELDRFALRVARQARFSPGRVNGRAVATWVQFPIHLTPPPPDPPFPPRDQPRY